MKSKRHNLLKGLTFCLTPATIAFSFMIAMPAMATDAIWIGAAGDNVFGTAANWNPATAPTVNDDTATWNGTQPGALSILWTAGIGGFGGNGINLVLTGAQTDAVTLNSTGSSIQLGLNGISIAAGAGPFTIGGTTGTPTVTFRTGASPAGSTNPILLNDSVGVANTATIKSNVTFNSGSAAGRAITFDGAGNWQVDCPLTTPNASGAVSVTKNGVGVLTITNTNASQNNGYSINDGTLVVGGSGLLGGPSGVFSGTVAVVGGTLSFQSTASQTISSAISGSGVLTQGAGTLTLTGVNTRTGTTTVTGGTMVLGGAGQSASSGLTINGASAKFVQTSSVPSTTPITLTQGSLDGTTTVGNVSVGNGTGGIIRNGNGGTGALTIGNLSFGGAGSLNFNEDGVASTPGVIVTGALSTTPANGTVTVNASQTSWASGTTFDLLTFGSFTGAVGNFTKGTISGLSVRQSAALVLASNKLSLQVTGDNPVWTGLDSGNWVIGATGPSGNWKLITGGTQTNYVAADTVLFDDSATGTTAVTISAANLSPSLVTFNNSTKEYTVSGGFGIVAGSILKTGTGKTTLSTANAYAGGTTVSAGTLALSGAGTLGAPSSVLTVNGTGIVDIGATSQTVGAVSLAGTGSIANGTLTPTTVSATSASAAVISAIIAGSGSVVQTGTGSLTLSGANSHTGGTTATSGTLILSGAGKLGATTGALNLNGSTLDLGGTNQTVGTITKSGAGLISNGTLAFSVFNDTHTAGTGTISAKLTGTGELNLIGAGGTLVLTGANDYTGATLIASGTVLRLGDGGTTGSLNPLSDITVQNGGRFSTNRSDTVTQGVDFGLLTGGVQGGVILNGTGTTIFNLENTFTAGGSMSAGTVVAASNSALGTGANGPFSITGGSLQLTNNIALAFGADIITHGEAAASDTVGSLMSTGNNSLTGNVSFGNAGTGNISNLVSLSGTLTINGGLSATLGGRTFNFGGPGNSVVVGAITGEVAVSKSGPGTTTLSSFSNDYTGGTTIQNGTLSIQGTSAGNVMIDGAAAVLAGTGIINGDIDLMSGAIAPGDSVTPIGTLALDFNLYLSPTASKFIFDLSSDDNSSDLLYMDQLFKDTGTVTFNFKGGVVGETYTLFEFLGTNLAPADVAAFVATGGTGTFSISSGKFLTYKVLTVEQPAAYDSWSADNAGGEAANLDFDKDGVSNGVEYFMGQTGSSFTANPGLVNGTVTWAKDPAYNGTFEVQTSTNLINWVPASPAPVIVEDSVQYTPGTGLGKIFTRLVVTPN